MKRMSDSRRWVLSCALVLGLVGQAGLSPEPASAQDAGVVKRLRKHAKLKKRAARHLVRDVEAHMSVNAERGGDDYDAVRQAVGEVLFPGQGPGRTMEIFRTRHAQVILQLYRGLDERLLQGLFGPPGSMKRCKQDLGMAARDCAALVAAARSEPVSEVQETVPVSGLSQHLKRARAALAAGDLGQAESSYMAITRADPSHAMAFAGLGLTRGKQGKLKAAITAYETAVSLAPNLISLHVVLGRAYRRAGRKGQARASFQQALVLDPGHAEAQRQLRGMGGRSARLTPAGKQRAKAAKAYRKGRYAAALTGYQRAANTDPSYAGTYAGIGACYLQLGDPDAAVRAYQMATQLKPTAAGLHAALGRALTLQGQTMSARAAFTSALHIDPNNRSARIGLAKLTASSGGQVYAVKPAKSRFAKYASGWSPPPTKTAAPAAPAATATTPVTGAAAPAEAAEATSAPAAQDAKAPAEAADATAATPAEVAAEAAPPVEPEPEEQAAEDSLMAGLLSDPSGATAGTPVEPIPDATPHTPSRDQIATVMRGLTSKFADCVGKDFKGPLKLSFTVAGNTGEVIEGDAEGPIAETDAGGCVNEVLMGAKFPLFLKDLLKIKYPVKL